MRSSVKTRKLALMLAGLVMLSACNTIQGLGKDVKSAGQGIERGAESVRDGGKKGN